MTTNYKNCSPVFRYIYAHKITKHI